MNQIANRLERKKCADALTISNRLLLFRVDLEGMRQHREFSMRFVDSSYYFIVMCILFFEEI